MRPLYMIGQKFKILRMCSFCCGRIYKNLCTRLEAVGHVSLPHDVCLHNQAEYQVLVARKTMCCAECWDAHGIDTQFVRILDLKWSVLVQHFLEIMRWMQPISSDTSPHQIAGTHTHTTIPLQVAVSGLAQRHDWSYFCWVEWKQTMSLFANSDGMNDSYTWTLYSNAQYKLHYTRYTPRWGTLNNLVMYKTSSEWTFRRMDMGHGQ